MPNSPAVIASRMTSMIQLQGSSVFSLPRLSKGNDGIKCLRRNYGSSDGPVRYIPKKGVKKVEEDRESTSAEAEVPGSMGIWAIPNGKAMAFKVLKKEVDVGSRLPKGEVPGPTESRKIPYFKAMTMKVSHKKVGDGSWVQKEEVLDSIKSQEISDGKAMSFNISREGVGHRSRVQKGEVSASTECQKIPDGKAMKVKDSRKEFGNRIRVSKEEVPQFNSGRVPGNNDLSNSLASPGIIKRSYKHNLAAEGEISPVLDELDGDYMEMPEQDSEEIVFRSSKVNNGREVIMNGEGRNDVEKKAIQLLATRAYTAVELRKKLCGKHFPPDVVESLINDFQERGLINDSLYAEAFSRSRWSSSCWGPVRIKHELYKKGIKRVDAENAVRLVFQDSDTHGEEESPGQAFSKMSLEHLYAQASKQWVRSRGAPIETRKSRLVRWLQYRGFNWGVISNILRKLESQASSERE